MKLAQFILILASDSVRAKNMRGRIRSRIRRILEGRDADWIYVSRGVSMHWR